MATNNSQSAPTSAEQRSVIEAASAEAKQFLTNALEQLVQKERESHQAPDRKVPLLFPNGIELIRLTFDIGKGVTIELTIAGEKAPKVGTIIDEREITTFLLKGGAGSV